MAQSLDIRESYVSRVPVPDHIPDALAALKSACIALKRHLVARDPTERSFAYRRPRSTTLADACRRATDEADSVAAVLDALEGISEREVFAAYGVAGEYLQAVLDETGAPAGWFPFIAGYDAIPQLPQGLQVSAELLAPLAREPRRTPSAGEHSDLKRRLRALYESGPGAKAESDDAYSTDETDEDDDGAAVSGARIPIPAETFLEELAQKLEIHPISIYWLLRELREKDGVICRPELRRFVEDYVSVTVLGLLGHRWPREVESGEGAPSWIDPDGIIPIGEGTGEGSLRARVRARITEDFGRDRVNAIEREFAEIAGKPLELWIASNFFSRHVSQFRKRPIAWHLQSRRTDGANRSRRGRVLEAPAFSCLIYYHCLDSDLLPRLRTQYVGPTPRTAPNRTRQPGASPGPDGGSGRAPPSAGGSTGRAEGVRRAARTSDRRGLRLDHAR